MNREEAINYLTSTGLTEEQVMEVVEALRQQTCEDAISREDALMALTGEWTESRDEILSLAIRRIRTLPSVRSQYTEDEIQKMQELEQAEIQKAYELGKTEGQKSEDAVSREAVLMELDKYLCGVPFDEKGIDEVIKELPSVNPQPKTGYWIQTQEKDDAEPCILWECSCCHKEFRSVVHKVSNYCPSCGCRIVESQERSE